MAKFELQPLFDVPLDSGNSTVHPSSFWRRVFLVTVNCTGTVYW